MCIYRIIDERTQEFNGEIYKLWGDEVYFGNYRGRLHRVVWEYYFGKIPKGFAVHHIDGDRQNNHITNLQILTLSEHGTLHSSEPDRITTSKRTILEAIKCAPKWHRSEEGKEWHREHAARTGFGKFSIKCVCEECGKEYISGRAYKQRFCSKNCKAANRYKSGVDDITVICKTCGKEFRTNKYAKRANCSKECLASSRGRRKRAS